MKASLYNINISQGALFEKPFVWSVAGTPVDLTGYTAKLEILDTDTGEQIDELSTTLDVNGNGIILGGSAGTVQIVIKTAMTETFTFQRATYQMELTRPDGEDLPFLYGGVYLKSKYPNL